MIILVFGNGYLGNKIASYLDASITSFDVFDASCKYLIADLRPDVVINAVGKSGANIDWCELPENRDLALRANGVAPYVLWESVQYASERLKKSIQYVHLSSACVWSEGINLNEQVPMNPCSWYGYTKMYAERLLPVDKVLILRIHLPVDNVVHNRNLITKIAKYHEVLDKPNSITILPDFLMILKRLLQLRKVGVYNIANRGALSMAQLADLYKKYVDNRHNFIVVDDLPMLAKRSNVVMDIGKVERELGCQMMDISVRIVDILRTYKKRL